MTARAKNELFTLIRFMARRDRLRVPIWIISIAGVVILSATSFPEVYQSAAERQARATLMDNPSVSLVAGSGHGLEDYTFGAMMTQEMMPLTLAVVALMSLLLVVRHTRADEADGRSELITAYTNSRRSILLAAIIWVSVVNLILGTVLALGLGALGIESITWAGSWMFSLAITGVGLVFVGIAALTAQLTQSSRGAAGLAGLILGAFYLLRALGDAGGNFLSWLSPFGWALGSKAYVDNQWWTLALPIIFSLACIIVAMVVAKQRDYGAGLLKVRPGRSRGSRWLNSPLMLILRLQRTSLIAWTISMAVFGLLYGTLAPEIEKFVEDLSSLAIFEGNGNILETFLSTVIVIIAITAASFGVISLSRAKSEETAGRAELILATPVRPVHWLIINAALAFAGSILVLLAASGAMAASAAVAIGNAELFWRLLGSALTYIPAVWLVIGLAAALYGLTARALGLVWLVIIYSAIVWTFGVLFRIPEWLFNLSPFEHVPQLPVESLRLTPLILLSVAGLVAFLASVLLIRRRDIATR